MCGPHHLKSSSFFSRRTVHIDVPPLMEHAHLSKPPLLSPSLSLRRTESESGPTLAGIAEPRLAAMEAAKDRNKT
jgi:hypothetical protein